MSLRFIYGKSGTGKTSYCFKEIKKLIEENKKVYIITPEQFSFTAENNLMATCGKKAVINAEVITFERMAYRVISEVGGINNNPISNCGKAMIISNIIDNHKNNLKFLGKTNQNIELIMRLITEFKKNNITKESLEDNIKDIEDNYLKLKLNDIKIIYEEFRKAIINKFLDDDDLLTIIKDKISSSLLFKDSYVYIDEFVGFTKQEYLIIEEILNIANQVNITICTDSLESNLYKENDIFLQNKKTIEKLKDLAKKNNIKILNSIKMETLYRYKNEELLHLEENLYSINHQKFLNKIQSIHLFLANNNYSEIENVANNIIELVRDQKYKYSDISIITKDISEYSGLIKSIFSKYEIPVFIDEKKELNQNILVKYIISLLDIFANGWTQESIFNYLKSSFITEINDDEKFLLENYCKRCGIKGFKKFKEEWKNETNSNDNIELLNNLRIKFIGPLIILKSDITKYKTVKDITKSLYSFLEQNNIKNKLLEKIDKFNQNGKVEFANIYNTSWNVIIDIFDELVLTLGEEKVSFESYINLIKVAFNNSSLGKIPATLDEIIVGDVDRTRSSKKKAIFIIGLNDGKFPSINKNEGFINDGERIYLKEKNIELAKTTKEQIYDENFNIYKAFTIAEEKLYLSYSASDNEGKGLRKSILINKINKIFPNIKEESDIIKTNTYINSRDITFDLLLLNLRKYLNGEGIDPIWFRIYDIYNNDNEYKYRLLKSLEGINYTNIPQDICKENLDRMYGETLNTSISKLESYRRCPFSYYLKYGLKLSDRTELKLERLDSGTLMHDIIDEFFEILNTKNIKVKEITEDEIENIIEEILKHKLELKQNYIFSSNSKYIILTRRLRKVIIKSVKYIIQGLKSSDFNVLGTEIEFGNGKYYDPITIKLDDGKKVEIIGKIDRIDIAENNDNKYIRIIDYKSSIKNIDLNEVVAGIQIQLLTYLDAVSKKEDAELAGVLYFNLIDPIIKSKNKNLTEEEIENEIRNNFKMNGLILGDIEIIRKMDNTLITGNSNVIPAYIDKEGNISKNKSSILEKEDFKILESQIEKIIKEISDDILTGNIVQKPVYLLKNRNTACDYCKYRDICGFDSKNCNNNYNYIPNFSKNEVVQNIRDNTE